MDIQHEIDNFVAAVERLRGVTAYINGLADQVEGLAAEGAPVPGYGAADFTPNHVNQAPTAAANYPAPPAPTPAFVPQTPQEPAPAATQTTGVGAPGGAPVEGQETPTTAPVAPAPAAPVAAQTPWEAQAAEPAPAAAEPKKSGRRTNEELAAELGVSLNDVKQWKGGGRISKADMEEFKRLHPDAVAAPAAAPAPATAEPANPFGGPAVPAQQAPVTAPAAPVTPQAAPVAPQPAPVAAPGQGAPQEWPAVGQPVAAPPANVGEQFGDWPAADGGFNVSNPFGG